MSSCHLVDSCVCCLALVTVDNIDSFVVLVYLSVLRSLVMLDILAGVNKPFTQCLIVRRYIKQACDPRQMMSERCMHSFDTSTGPINSMPVSSRIRFVRENVFLYLCCRVSKPLVELR
jgi:hypothetical protein